VITLDSDNVVFYDVDETLVMWHKEKEIEIIDPYDKQTLFLKPHKRHIKLLKDHKTRGRTIVVWSAGGYQWAQRVVETLGLTKYVDLVMTKPSCFIDDLPAQEVLVNRIYLEDK
jgi:phosphoserine phosphatase